MSSIAKPAAYYDDKYWTGVTGPDDQTRDNGVAFGEALRIRCALPFVRLLDCGCGPGWTVRHLRNLHRNAVGVDFSPAALRRHPCRPAAAAQANMIELPFPDGTFDIVRAWNVLEHLDKWLAGRALREMTRVGTQNAVWLFAIALNDDPQAHQDPSHTLLRTRQWWLAGFRAFGLAVAPHAEVALTTSSGKRKRAPRQSSNNLFVLKREGGP